MEQRLSTRSKSVFAGKFSICFCTCRDKLPHGIFLAARKGNSPPPFLQKMYCSSSASGESDGGSKESSCAKVGSALLKGPRGSTDLSQVAHSSFAAQSHGQLRMGVGRESRCRNSIELTPFDAIFNLPCWYPSGIRCGLEMITILQTLVPWVAPENWARVALRIASVSDHD